MTRAKQCWCGAVHSHHRYERFVDRRMVPLNESIYKPVRVAFCESGHEYAYTSFGLGKNFEVRNRVFALRRLDSVPRDLSHGLFSKFPIC